ncbi:MAG: DUF3182 family protein [Candidatus Rokubacteria bacterium]|nr:DUF3182 family protein [Candidatus Rokubacteria bacterium]
MLADEAARLGIRTAGDLFGGIVPFPFVGTKAITHALVSPQAERPTGWSEAFSARTASVVLPGSRIRSSRTISLRSAGRPRP